MSQISGNARVSQAPEQTAPRAALIANPEKVSLADLGDRLAVVSEQTGFDRPLVLPTTARDTGARQAREALAAGVSRVVVSGGDGTVRPVAGALAGSSAVLGLLPTGTANLLARNLGLPLHDDTAALGVAMTGPARAVDVVEVELTRPDGTTGREPCVVGAGIGFDADLMAGADDDLKQRFGWFAYVVSGARAVAGRPVATRLRVGEGEAVWQAMRTVLVANCGLLTGGLRLTAESQLDDGWLEVVVASPRRPEHWAGVLGRLLRGDGQDSLVMRVERATQVALEPAQPLVAQIDGDPLGPVCGLRASVRHRALRVAVPADG